jgi:thiol-disulfide isomerase/thioredoxin
MEETTPRSSAMPIAIGILAVLVLVGLVFAAMDRDANEPQNDMMMEETEMMNEDAMHDDTMMDEDSGMMEKEGAMMDDAVMMDDTMMEDGEGAMMQTYSGTVLAGSSAPILDFTKADYDAALASDKLVVLYFYANWCPICVAETADALYPVFNALTGDDVVGFRVSYNDNETDDNERALAKQYGVAYQHTKVFVKNGERVLKSPEGWDIARYNTEINNAR